MINDRKYIWQNYNAYLFNHLFIHDYLFIFKKYVIKQISKQDILNISEINTHSTKLNFQTRIILCSSKSVLLPNRSKLHKGIFML